MTAESTADLSDHPDRSDAIEVEEADRPGMPGSDPKLPGRAVPVALGVFVALAFAPVFRRLVSDLSNIAYGYNDYGIHLEMAARVRLFPPTVVTPHPIFHVLAAAFGVVLGAQLGAVAALCVGAGAGAVLLYWIARQPVAPLPALPRALAAAVALYETFFETPVTALNALGWLDHPRTYMNLHPWASPTDVVAVPIAVAVVVVMARSMEAPRADWFRPTPPRLLLLAATVAGGLAKPTVLLALLPAFVLYALIGGPGLKNRITTLLWSVVPAAVLFAWQLWIIKSRPLAVEIGYSTYGIEFAPFRYVGFLGFGPDGPWLFWPSLLWVVLAAWAGGRAFWRHPWIRLCLCALPGVSVLAFFLAETGNQAADMNLVRSLTYALVPLTYFSVILLAQALLRWFRQGPDRGRVPLWIPASAVLAVLWAIGGLFMYVDLVGASDWFSLQPTSVLPRLR